MEQILSYLTSKTFVGTIILIAIGLVVWQIIRRIHKFIFRKESGAAATTSHVLYDILKYIILVLVVLGILQINGVNVTSLLAGFGIASAIVGLALQDFLKDVIMGIHLMTDHFFEVGDVVRYGETEGVVVSFNVRTTKIRSLGGDILTICNRNISEITKSSRVYVLDLPLSYTEDEAQITTILDELCAHVARMPEFDKCAYKGIQSLDASSVAHRIIYECEPADHFKCHRQALTYFYNELKARGIEIPYQKLDVQILSAPAKGGANTSA